MKPWNYLLEAADDYMVALRDWKRTNSAESVNKFIAIARRTGNTNNSDYFRALWEVGERPPRLSAKAIALSDSIDYIILDISNEMRMSIQHSTDLLDNVIRATGVATWDGFQNAINRIILHPKMSTLDDVRRVDRYVHLVVKAITRNARELGAQSWTRKEAKLLDYARRQFMEHAGLEGDK